MLVKHNIAGVDTRVEQVVHPDDIQAAHERSPHPCSIATHAPDVIRVCKYDFSTVVWYWGAGDVPISPVWRYIIGGATEYLRVSTPRKWYGHADRVPLCLPGLVALDVVYHIVLPLHRTAVALVADLVKHVVEVVHGVDDLTNVGFLGILYRGGRCRGSHC